MKRAKALAWRFIGNNPGHLYFVGLTRGWWLTGQTVPAAIAGTCQSICLLGFVIPTAMLDGKTYSTVFLCIFAVLAILGSLGGWASVRTLRRHPGWVREPASPFLAKAARQRWAVGLISLGVILADIVAQIWLRSSLILILQFIACIGGMWAFSGLVRRAGSSPSPVMVSPVRNLDG